MPSSEIISRERLSAWQRWELGALSGGASVANYPAQADTAATGGQNQLALETANAMAEARAAGYAEGREQAAAEHARLAVLVHALSQGVGDHEQRLADEVLDLALLLARQMVGEALTVRREFLLPAVSAALRQLPHATMRIEIVLNPSDLPLVQAFIGAEPLGDRCHLSAHPAMAPGGCRIETEQCEVDATVPSRWKRLLAALGRSNEWLEPL